MNLSDNSIARNISINSFDINRSIRGIYKNIISDKDIIMSEFIKIINNIEDPYISINTLCKHIIDDGYRIIILENKNFLKFPFIFKFKGKLIKPLYTYNAAHIRASVIRSILLNGDDAIDIRINRAVYILYYFWFFNKDNIKDITFNVCVDIKIIISTLIDKGFSLYKDYIITNDIVNKLRTRLDKENLLELSN